jgi:hypothetical protein
MRIALLRCNPDCATFNPTLLDGEQGKKRDDCGTDHGILIPAPEQHESAYLLPENAVDGGVVFGI